MRLTKKLNDGYISSQLLHCEHKLGQLEDILEDHNIETLEELDGLLLYAKQIKDIEEELGFDLIKLFKAFKNGAWFKNPYYKNEINFIENYSFSIDFDNQRFDIRMVYFVKPYDYKTGGALFFFKDYGKTWALTKEELSNE